jgi:FkbM family methyltransferase
MDAELEPSATRSARTLRARGREAALSLATEAFTHTSLRLERADRLAQLRWAARRFDWLDSLLAHGPAPELLPRAQLGQDLFVLNATSFKREGFFVEFGGGDGLNLSNTVLLERSFDWTGIVAEPARVWHEDLSRNRSCAIDTRCVWTTSGDSLDFAEAPAAEFSTVRELLDLDDGHRDERTSSTLYKVTSVSLDDLLDEHSAPEQIDYLSIDTEGTEYEILSAFDFARRRIQIITVEHNFDDERRRQIYDLLTGNGFARVLEEMSNYDDWYVSE